jgi:hypothetical protein
MLLYRYIIQMNTTKTTLIAIGSVLAGVAITSSMLASSRMGGERTQDDSLRTVIHETISKGDYDTFLEIANDKALQKIPDQSAFDEVVARHQDKDAHHEALTQAVADDDLAAFTAVVQEMHASQENTRRYAPTDTQIQKKFDRAVEHYAEHGELPAHRRGHGRGHRSGR